MVGDIHTVLLALALAIPRKYWKWRLLESGLLGSLLFPADAFEPVPAEGSEQAVYS